MEDQTKRIGLYLVGPLIALNIAALAGYQQTKPDWLLHVDFLDVGQGDAIFVQTHLGNQILIDGGPSDRVLAELGSVMPFYDRSLDLVILTHPDADHVSGLVDVLRRYQVEKVMLTGVSKDTEAYRQFAAVVESEHAELFPAQTGQRVWLDQSTVFDVYYPNTGVAEEKLATNDTSVSGKLRFGQTSIVLTGDGSDKVERRLVSVGFDLNADLLKIGHHGSRFSSSLEFLQAVSPEYAVISVGENNYGHPTEEALGRIRAVNAEILRTDEQGTIRFVSDGEKLKQR